MTRRLSDRPVGIRRRWPLLGICYGAQYLAKTSGGTVESADSREYGKAELVWHDAADPLMQGSATIPWYG